MTVRVSPEEVLPSHHFALQDREGKMLGLLACNPTTGKRLDIYDESLYIEIPVTTTAAKQTSG